MPALSELLAQEAKLVDDFVALLSAEQEELKVGRIDALDGLSQRKADLAAQLNAAESRRNAWLNAAGLAGDREGMAAWLAAFGGKDAQAAANWARLLEKATEARNLNQLNGQLIALRLSSTTQALATLTAQHQAHSLYGPNGQAAPRTGSRIIDAA